MVDHALVDGESARARATPTWALGLVLLQTFAFFVPAATWAPMSRYGVTRALVEEQSIALGAWAVATGDRSQRDGVWYSDKAPLPALLATVPYGVVRLAQWLLARSEPDFRAHAVGRVPAVRVQLNQSAQRLLYASSLGVSGVAGALVGVWTLLWLRRRFPLGASVFGASAIVLATPLFPYSTSFFGHAPAAACLMGAVYFGELQAHRRRLVLSGALLAGAVGCEYLSAIPAATLAIFLALASDPPASGMRARWIAGAKLLAGGIPVVLVIGAYHHVAFGGFWETGYSHLTDATFRAGHAHGFMGIGAPSVGALFGLTFGPGRGLFYVAPVLLLAVIALLRHGRSSDLSVKVGLGGFVVMLIANAGYYMWGGGAATGPRHLVPVIPALAPGLAIAWSWVRVRPVTIVLVSWSALTMLAFAAVGIEAGESGEAVFGYAWARLLDGHVAGLSSATNLGLILGLPSIASLIPLWLLWVFGGRWIWRLTRESGSEPAEASAARS